MPPATPKKRNLNQLVDANVQLTALAKRAKTKKEVPVVANTVRNTSGNPQSSLYGSHPISNR